MKGGAASRQLSEVVRFHCGGTPARDNAGYWGGEIPWVSPKDMRSPEIGSSEERLTEAGVRGSATRVVSPGSVLVVVRSGILARHVPVAVTTHAVAFNQDVKALTSTHGVEPRYVAAFLRASEQHILREGVKKGATVHSIKSGFLEALHIPLPPLPEQRRIADAIDAAIAEAEAAARAAEVQRTDLDRLEFSIFEAAFPVPPLALKDDNAPDGWVWHRLTDVARLESGHTPSRRHPEWWGGDTPWLALPDIRALDGRTAYETVETINEAGLANSSARELPAGTVCLCRDASIGYVTVLGRTMATSQHFANWICSSELLPWFLVFALIASRAWLRERASGAILPTIYMPTLKALRVCVPDIHEQARIVAHVERCRAELTTARDAAAAQKAAAGTLPSAILTAAFQGQL